MKETNGLNKIIDIIFKKAKKEKKSIGKVIDDIIKKIEQSDFTDEEKAQSIKIMKDIKDIEEKVLCETDENGHLVICRLSSDHYKGFYNKCMKENEKRGK